MVGSQTRAWHFPAVVAFTFACAWFVFAVGERPPGVTYFDVAVHEAGHVAFAPLGTFVMLLMGNVTQVGFPLLLAAFQLMRRRDLVTGATLLAWAGEACGDSANYIADAVRSRYLLLGGSEGDWARLFGPEHLDRLDLAIPVSNAVRITAVGLMLTAIAVAVYGFVMYVAQLRAANDDSWANRSGRVSAEPSRTGSYRVPWQSEPPVGIRPRRSASAS